MALRSNNRDLFGGGGRGGKNEPEDRGPSDQELTNEVDQLEKDMNELRSTYELYFMGIEKLEPSTARDLIKSALRRFEQGRTRNTALKFRVKQLKARMISLENYWTRVNRQREAGTYKRDNAKVARREAEIKQQEAAAKRLREVEKGNAPRTDVASTAHARQAPGEGQAITGAALREGRSQAVTSDKNAGRGKAGKAGGEMGRPSAKSAEDLTEPKLRRLYQTYVGARKRCGEKVDLRYEDMAAALRKQVPRLMTQTGAKAVEFKVVIRGGRAVLKALPKHK